ncbi:hypothetical protein SY88_22940 [Clostridiales bacterium PH28_bin88]|nr:hypothetical protein SY88_22940 [Clostridiales bacterium PH28_bin88]
MARVLVIEDEPGIAMVLREVLREEGHNVITVPNGVSGLERLRRAPVPEIVLVDLVMPRMNGRAVVEAMRSDPMLQDIPVIIITGSLPCAENLPPEGSYQAFISKPFDLTDVLETVHSLLDSRYSSSTVAGSYLPLHGT